MECGTVKVGPAGSNTERQQAASGHVLALRANTGTSHQKEQLQQQNPPI